MFNETILKFCLLKCGILAVQIHQVAYNWGKKHFGCKILDWGDYSYA